MEIYDVKVCKFVSMEPKENFENVILLTRGEFVTHYCVVDFDTFVATDVLSGEQFRVLKKNVHGQILRSEQIELNHNYALRVNNVDFSQLSWGLTYRLKLACLRMQLLGTTSKKKTSHQKQNLIKR